MAQVHSRGFTLSLEATIHEVIVAERAALVNPTTAMTRGVFVCGPLEHMRQTRVQQIVAALILMPEVSGCPAPPPVRPLRRNQFWSVLWAL